MKRNMETIRRIILATAELPYGEVLKELNGMSVEEFVMHAQWLKEAGLIDATLQAGSGSFAKFAIIFRLTWDGCEFSDAISSDTLWKKANDVFFKPGISFTFDALKEWLKTEIKNGLPTLGNIAS